MDTDTQWECNAIVTNSEMEKKKDKGGGGKCGGDGQ